MKKAWFVSFMAVAVLFPEQVLAAETARGKVRTILSYLEQPGLLIALDQPIKNPGGCGGTSWYIYPDDAPRAAFIQSLLLTSYESRGEVELTIDGCYQNYPRIRHVTLPPK